MNRFSSFVLISLVATDTSKAMATDCHALESGVVSLLSREGADPARLHALD